MDELTGVATGWGRYHPLGLPSIVPRPFPHSLLPSCYERSGWQRPERAESTQPRASPWVLMRYIYTPCKGKSKYTTKVCRR